MIYLLAIFSLGRPRALFGRPFSSYRLGQIAQGGIPMAWAIIPSIFGQGLCRAALEDPATYPWATDNRRRVQPRFSREALMSAGCQSEMVIFFWFLYIAMVLFKTGITTKKMRVKKKISKKMFTTIKM